MIYPACAVGPLHITTSLFLVLALNGHSRSTLKSWAHIWENVEASPNQFLLIACLAHKLYRPACGGIV